MDDVLFERAQRADLAAILALLLDDSLGKTREAPLPSEGSAGLDPAYLDAFSAIEADPNQLLVVMRYHQKMAGCFQLSFIPGLSRKGQWRGQIESVRIAAHLRGQGLGQRMMAWAIETCRARGCGLVQLSTDKSRLDAHRFYERLGFIASHEGMKLAL